MNRIRLLSEQVANQIAAGEVVERPASVVKELVENALDAGATRISVEIAAGGRSLIRVTDDGTGMSRDDALLCLERHATSKIRSAEDLASIATMGFRGEAIPSIASVSRFTLTTREREPDSPEGTQVIINGGKIADVKAAGSASGTSVEVRQLFFNVPARRKFLRSDETEAAHVLHYVTLAALAHPGVAFTFIRDGRTLWQLPAVRPEGDAFLTALRERWRALLPSETRLLPVDFTGALGAVRDPEPEETVLSSPTASHPPQPILRLRGLIGAPGVSRSTREDQHLFVNRRPIEHRGLNMALVEGFHTALMKGRYPVCCLFLEIDPALVDVNIHPSKREVKFHDERGVRRAVAEAVRQALLAFHETPMPDAGYWMPERTGVLPSPVITPVADHVSRITPAPSQLPLSGPTQPPLAVQAEPLFVKLAKEAMGADARSRMPDAGSAPEFQAVSSPESSPSVPPTTPSLHHSATSVLLPASGIRHPASDVSSSSPTPLLSVPLRLVGVVGRLYVVLESDRGLVLLDQHAAHERILFEQMLRRLEEPGAAASQRLLLPETIELSPRDAQFLRENLGMLTRLGVGLSEFGERTFLLDALPPFVKAPEPRRFVLELIDELKAAGDKVNSLRLGEHVVAKTVCRHAVKANDPLAGPELENLVNDLRRCQMPYTCPHGRPTLIEMNFRELEKKFGRVQ
jgi:DNA mismatch repair protein MutL